LQCRQALSKLPCFADESCPSETEALESRKTDRLINALTWQGVPVYWVVSFIVDARRMHVSLQDDMSGRCYLVGSQMLRVLSEANGEVRTNLAVYDEHLQAHHLGNPRHRDHSTWLWSSQAHRQRATSAPSERTWKCSIQHESHEALM